MFQFKPYPIYVLYSKHGQEHAFGNSKNFSLQGDDKMSNWMKTTGKYLREITEDTAPAHRHEVVAYENAVKKQLETIVSNNIGRLLFSLLNPNVKIWIVPIVEEESGECGCTAVTTPINDLKSGGGIRVLLNPSDLGANADDILFHELVHAYRASYKKYETKSVTEEYPTLEEFFALQMQNVYLSARGKKHLYFSYYGGIFQHRNRWGLKGSIYAHFIERADFIMAFKHLLLHEYLAMRTAHEKHSDFNPFRDFSTLERMSLESFNNNKASNESFLRQFPSF